MATTKSSIVESPDLRRLLAMMRDLPKEASAELRNLAQSIADKEAEHLKRVARSHRDKRVRELANTIRSRRDRIPVVVIGGAKRLDISGRAKAGDVLFGTEFGATPDGTNGWRFPARADSYWLFRTLEANHEAVVDEWQQAYAFVQRKWRGS